MAVAKGEKLEKIGLIVKKAETVLVAERYRDRLALTFQILTIIPALGWGIFHLRSGSNVIIGWADVVVVVTLIANIVAYPFHRRFGLSEMVYRIAAIFIIMTLVMHGAREGTGIFWAIAYPPMTFAVNGKKRGLQSIAMFMTTFALVMTLGFMGILPSFYKAGVFEGAWTVLILLASVAYVKEKERENAFGEIDGNREQLRVLLESLPAGVIMFDSAGLPVAANPAAEVLLGRPIDPRISADGFIKAYALTKEGGAPYVARDFPLGSALAHGVAAVKSDVFVNRPDGSLAVLRFAAAPVLGEKGHVVSAVAVIEDATKEHEIDQMKSEFVSLASHQLKTPLTGIKWSVETLLGGDSGPLTEEQREHVGQIDATVERLSRLVADLLTVSRIETGRKFNVVRKPTDVVPMIKDVVRESEIVGKKTGVTIMTPTLPPSLMLDVDEGKIREVVANIVGNAVKYSKQGGVVEVGVSGVDDGHAVIMVKDTGLGIPKDQQSRMFEKFFRAENVAGEIEGTGLGLYVVKAIVEKHDGRIWFESEEGKGTTFFVELPVPKA